MTTAKLHMSKLKIPTHHVCADLQESKNTLHPTKQPSVLTSSEHVHKGLVTLTVNMPA